MKEVKGSILVVDDDDSVRGSLVEIFTYLGYRIRTATSGLSALIQIREEVPEILLSDLNMPEMSGFELLSIVRRRFPAIFVIAMSGMVPESTEIPSGVTADAYHQKGGRVADLVKSIELRAVPDRERFNKPEPIWVQRSSSDAPRAGDITIACPECFRTFPYPVTGEANLILDINCASCQSRIIFAVVAPDIRTFPAIWQEARNGDQLIDRGRPQLRFPGPCAGAGVHS